MRFYMVCDIDVAELALGLREGGLVLTGHLVATLSNDLVLTALSRLSTWLLNRIEVSGDCGWDEIRYTLLFFKSVHIERVYKFVIADVSSHHHGHCCWLLLLLHWLVYDFMTIELGDGILVVLLVPSVDICDRFA